MGFGWKNIKSGFNKVKKVTKPVTNIVNKTVTKTVDRTLGTNVSGTNPSGYTVGTTVKDVFKRDNKTSTLPKDAPRGPINTTLNNSIIKNWGKEDEHIANKSFRKLADDPDTQSRLKELSRRASTGIETGMEELERSQKQSQVGGQTSANLRAMAALGADKGVKGATQASRTAGVLAGGMNQMATFEGDLAARDLAAKQAASERKSQMVADVSQFDIGQDKAKLEYTTGRKDFKDELRNNIVTTMVANKEYPINEDTVNEKLATVLGA